MEGGGQDGLKVDHSRWMPEGYGYYDCLILCDVYIHVIDFKHGFLVIPAERDPQLICYALGGIDTFSCPYDIRSVKLSIFQPRRALTLQGILKGAS